MPEEHEQQNDQARYRKEIEKRIKAMQAEQQKREIAKKYLTVEAYERLMNVRISNKDLYDQLLNLIIAMVQSNRITVKLTEDQLKGILAKMIYRPEPKLEFKHK